MVLSHSKLWKCFIFSIKNNRTRPLLLLGAFLWLTLSSAIFADELADVLLGVRPSIVAVGTSSPSGNPPATFLGTGFAVADGRYIVTNAHVIPKKLKASANEKLAVFSGRGQNFVTYEAQRIAEDTKHDLALLLITSGSLPPLRLGNTGDVREGDNIAFTGFPLGTRLGLYPVTHRGMVSSIAPIAVPRRGSQQLDSTTIAQLRNPYDVFQLDATAYPGNSGSPIYSPTNGRVLGVINKIVVKKAKKNSVTDPSGITFAIPADYIHQLLYDAGISSR